MSADRKEEFRKRTRKFALDIVRAYTALPRQRDEVRTLGKQMLRSGTSVEANYREASRARSNAEFVSKIETCAQEADETLLWIELLREGCDVSHPELERLWNEANELIAIFVTMAKNVKGNM